MAFFIDVPPARPLRAGGCFLLREGWQCRGAPCVRPAMNSPTLRPLSADHKCRRHAVGRGEQRHARKSYSPNSRIALCKSSSNRRNASNWRRGEKSSI